MELLRQRLASQVDNIELEYTRGVIGVAKVMGWTIDYIMELGIGQYNQVGNALKYFNEEDERRMRESQLKKPQTFG